MIESPVGTYVVPSCDGVSAPLILDIKAVVMAEARLREVATVNAHTAPDLLATYNEHWLTLHNAVTQLTYLHNLAKMAAADAKAEAVLACTDAALKDRGHNKTSEGLRDAMATLDPGVRKANERVLEIKAVLDYLGGKKTAFENAYHSVKKILGGNQLPPEPLNYGAKQPWKRTDAAVVRPAGPAPKVPNNDTLFDDDTFDLPGWAEPNYGRR